jgi:hypothetical protein
VALDTNLAQRDLAGIVASLRPITAAELVTSVAVPLQHS